MRDQLERNLYISRDKVSYLGLIFLLSFTVTYWGKNIILKVANLYTLKVPEHLYFQFSNVKLLYVLMPLAVINSLIILLLPGLFLSLSIGKADNWNDLLIQAFSTSFILHFFSTSTFKLFLDMPLNAGIFLLILFSGAAIGWAILAFRVFKGDKLFWPLAKKIDFRRLCWTLAIPAVVLLALLPVIFWQDLHDDGLEALEIGRSLSNHMLPRFPVANGLYYEGLAMIPMAFPVHWFVTLFGPVEASARLPILIYLPLLFCLLIQLIEWRSSRALGLTEEIALFIAVAVYTVTMSYNASYDPYFADIAAPAAFETLTVVCLLGTIYFLWKGNNIYFFFFALMTYLCRPTGLLLLGLLGLSAAFFSPEYRRHWIIKILAAISLCLLIAFIYSKFYVPWIVGDSGIGNQLGILLGRFRFLRFDDLSRINYVMFPCGILPFISLFAFRWQDSLDRVIAVLSLGYFIFFYCLAFVALHHFVPVMILPIIVFWRMYLHNERRFQRVILPAVVLTSVIAFYLSLPRHFEINRTVRDIGQETAFLVGDYYTDYITQVKQAELLFEFIHPDWEVKDPAKELVSGYLSIIYYSTRPKNPNADLNYIIQPLDYPDRTGFTRIACNGEAAIYVKDLKQWKTDRFRNFRTDYRSPLYKIDRSVLFRHWGEPLRNYSLDLKELITGNN